jgi:hypothetical protein
MKILALLILFALFIFVVSLFVACIATRKYVLKNNLFKRDEV